MTINDAGYYESDSANANDTKGNPASDPNIITCTSGGKKIKVMDTSDGYLQKKLLSNRTLPIITTMMDPRIDDMIDTCRGTPHKIATNLKKEFITDVTCSSVRVLQTPRNVSRTCRDRNTPGNTPYSVRSPQANSPFLIGVIGVSPTIGHSGILQVLNKRQSTVSDEIEDTQKLDTSVDIKLTNDGDSASIFIKVIGRELYHGSSADLYLRCWMDFASNIVME